MSGLLADLLVLAHAGFVLFVATGGLLVLRWPRLAWLHLPAVAWGVAVELAGWVCPLTPLENRLRAAAGEADYAGDFIGHWVLPWLYPAGLTRQAQWLLAGGALLINGVVYAVLARRLARSRRLPAAGRRATVSADNRCAAVSADDSHAAAGADNRRADPTSPRAVPPGARSPR